MSIVIAVDFDGTVVVQRGRHYADVTTPLEFIPGAPEALRALKAAGHTLLLWSGRASRALLYDPNLDPLVRAGVRPLLRETWEAARPLHQARYDQMVAFVERNLPGVFDAVDDGAGGKPSVDLFIDDKAFGLREVLGTGGGTWAEIADVLGRPT